MKLAKSYMAKNAAVQTDALSIFAKLHGNSRMRMMLYQKEAAE